jgi:excinuclease ABC subunit A
MGLEGGDGGGQVIATGTPEEICASSESHTAEYLRPKLGPPASPTPVVATIKGIAKSAVSIG